MDVAHVLEDGGGRELAYVAMSRARDESHIHVVAPTRGTPATERLSWAWEQERRQTWALDRQPDKTLAELYVERSRPWPLPSRPTGRPSWRAAAMGSLTLAWTRTHETLATGDRPLGRHQGRPSRPSR